MINEALLIIMSVFVSLEAMIVADEKLTVAKADLLPDKVAQQGGAILSLV